MLAWVEAANVVTVIAEKMQDDLTFMGEFKELFVTSTSPKIKISRTLAMGKVTCCLFCFDADCVSFAT